MLKVLVLLAAAAYTVRCVIYSGKCPKKDFPIHQKFNCPDIFGRDKRFKILAHLPTPNTSLNLYHNPMGAICDLEVQLMCTGMDEADTRRQPEVVKFSLQCNQTTQGTKFAFGCNYRSLNSTTHAWDVMTYDGCQPPKYWNSVNIVNYVPRLYAILWGCREFANNTHEQGAWILGYKKNFSESARMLDRALSVDLSFSGALSKDFILHNQTYSGVSSACSFKACEYYQLCKSASQDSAEIQ